MFKRLINWWRNRNAPKMIPVYGWQRSSLPDEGPEVIVLREILQPPTPIIRRSEWPAPEPKRLTRIGLNDRDIKQSASKWRVAHLPDECAFL